MRSRVANPYLTVIEHSLYSISFEDEDVRVAVLIIKPVMLCLDEAPLSQTESNSMAAVV